MRHMRPVDNHNHRLVITRFTLQSTANEAGRHWTYSNRLVYHILTGPLSCWKVEGSQKLKRTILMKSKLDEKPSQAKPSKVVEWENHETGSHCIRYMCVQCIEWLFFGCSSTDAHIDKFVMINEIKHCTSINKRSFELAQVHERP